MDIVVSCQVTEYAVIPNLKSNEINTFSINDKSLVISFCNDNEEVLALSEIQIEDAKKLAKIILSI